jgi:hypothetical protein
MNLCIDYDETYTRDPIFWNEVCQMACDAGHNVWCVSARHPHHMDDVEFTIGRVIGANRCVGTDGAAKKDFLLEHHGVYGDVWIDDTPSSVDIGTK